MIVDARLLLVEDMQACTSTPEALRATFASSDAGQPLADVMLTYSLSCMFSAGLERSKPRRRCLKSPEAGADEVAAAIANAMKRATRRRMVGCAPCRPSPAPAAAGAAEARPSVTGPR